MWFDVAILGVLVFTTIRGAMKGVVWQLAAIGALVACFMFSGSLSSKIAPYIEVSPPMNRWIAMFILYVGFSFLSFAIARTLHGWIEKARFTEYDRHLGAIFGFVKGVALCLVATFFLVTLSGKARALVLETRSGYAAAIVMDRLHPVMPAELHDVLEPYIHRLDRPGLDLRHLDSEHHAGEAGDPQDGHDHHGESRGEESRTDGDIIKEILAEIFSANPSVFDAELKNLAASALENTAEADRPELIEKFKTGVPKLIRVLAADWKNGKPAGGENAESMAAERARMLGKIAAVYSSFPEAQKSVVEEIEQSLSGVPDRVSLAVLSDWRADLLDRKPDPDPQTDSATSLDGRIVRQLSAAGISLNSLSSSLKSRLENLR